MKNQKGFTLLELVVVIIVLSVLAAVAIPKFVNLSAESDLAARAGTGAAVRSAFSMLVAQNAATAPTKDPWPDVATLAKRVTSNGMPANAQPTGVEFKIGGQLTILQTYTDEDCTAGQETSATTGQMVKCIGTFNP